jgi:hypothetical protein
MADPEWADLILSWEQRIRYVPGLRDLRPAVRGKWPRYQLAAAVYMQPLVMNGHYAWQTYRLPSPGVDDGRDGNGARLQALPDELTVDVHDQNLADQDGDVTWAEPVPMWRSLRAERCLRRAGGRGDPGSPVDHRDPAEDRLDGGQQDPAVSGDGGLGVPVAVPPRVRAAPRQPVAARPTAPRHDHGWRSR